ncbi:MAG: hypothetical protein NTY02_03910, partial [Acidobacteria bacterium]|nr:hypothetical protein [Acidobacteriota bacterium]
MPAGTAPPAQRLVLFVSLAAALGLAVAPGLAVTLGLAVAAAAHQPRQGSAPQGVVALVAPGPASL